MRSTTCDLVLFLTTELWRNWSSCLRQGIASLLMVHLRQWPKSWKLCYLLHLWIHTWKIKWIGKKNYFFLTKFNYVQNSCTWTHFVFLCVHLDRAEICLFTSSLEKWIIDEMVRLVSVSPRIWYLNWFSTCWLLEN